MNPPPPPTDRFFRIDAAAAADGTGLAFSPAAVLVTVHTRHDAASPIPGSATMVAVGSPAEVDAHPASPLAARITRPDCLLIPGLVNAHAHLDLSHIGPRPLDRAKGFGGFVDLVRRERVSEQAPIATSVGLGTAMSLAGGVVAVGDIAGAPGGGPHLSPLMSLIGGKLGGTSFLEFFAIGGGEDRGRVRALDAAEQGADLVGNPGGGLKVRLGLQPHAPTTVSLATYRWLLSQPQFLGWGLSTHLAETPDEHEFIRHARGPHRTFLESLGLWDDRMLDEIGHGHTPVEHLAPILAEAPFTCAHVNDASDHDIRLLAHTPTTVAYCPRASEYFLARDHFGPHRYRDMLRAGINVALGTDSIINLPPATNRLSTLDEARLLFRRDGTDPVTLLRMATLNGARALGLDEDSFAFTEGFPLAGMVAVPFSQDSSLTPLAAALSSGSAPELLFVGKA